MSVPFPREALTTKRGKHMVATFVEWVSEEIVASQSGSDGPVRYFIELDEQLREELGGWLGELEVLSVREFEEEGEHLRADADYQRSAGL